MDSHWRIDANSSSAAKMGKEFKFSAHLTSPMQSIICYVMCEQIGMQPAVSEKRILKLLAGSMRSAMLKPTVPSIAWSVALNNDSTIRKTNFLNPRQSLARQTTINMIHDMRPSKRQFSPNDEYGLDTIDDSDILKAAQEADQDRRGDIGLSAVSKSHPSKYFNAINDRHDQARSAAKMLPNGKYSCNHPCKDKNKCKHLCCREGLDHPPNESKKRKKVSDTITDVFKAATSGRVDNQRQMHTIPNRRDQQILANLIDDNDFIELDLTRDKSQHGIRRNEQPVLSGRDVVVESTQKANRLITSYMPDPQDLTSKSTIRPNRREGFEENTTVHARLPVKRNKELSFYDGDGFKELEDFTDYLEFSPVPLTDQNLAPNKPDKDSFDIDMNELLQESDTIRVSDDPFENMVHQKDYMDWKPDSSKQKEATDQWPKVDTDIDAKSSNCVSKSSIFLPPVGPRFKKSSHDDILSTSPIVMHTESSGSNQLVLSKTPKTNKLQLLDESSKSHDSVVEQSSIDACDQTEGKSKVSAQEFEAVIDNEEITTDTREDDIAFLLKEFGTCVEFV